ncbi:hypothetical protein JCM3770_005472 [Rhodotorula araucariae]
MLGSPPTSAAALPSFFVEDSDFLPSWSKAFSPSPRIGPTTVGSEVVPNALAGPSAVGLDAFDVDLGIRDASHDMPMLNVAGPSNSPNLGNGLSPVLSPTLMTVSPVPLADSQNDVLSGHPGVFVGQSRSSFESSFNQFHRGPPVDAPTPRKSPTRRKGSNASLSAPLSFDNVSTVPSASPELHAATTVDGPVLAPTMVSAAPRSPALAVPKLEQPTGNFAQGLPSGLQRRATLSGAGGEQETPRIQAYAKLEFPSFDIYIQKLSVTIGRRPAAPAARPSAASLPFDDARAAGLSLEDYILSLTDAALVKREETVMSIDSNAPALAASAKGKAVEDPFLEFVRSSPPAAASIAVEAPISTTTLPPLPALPAATPSFAFTPALQAPPSASLTDVDLGPLRAVSRQHARLSFDYDVGAWVLEVLGRNGVVVEGKWRAKGQKAVLTKKTKIQIAERIFHFVLPTIDVVTVEAGGAPATKPAKASSRDKSRLRVSGKGKGKGKAKKRVRGEDESSSSLSEVSDSDVELSPLMQPAPELSTTLPQKATSATPAVRPTPSPVPSISAPPAPRPATAGKASPAPLPAPLASTSASAASSSKPPRPSLSKAPATRSSKKPKAPPKPASPAASTLGLSTGTHMPGDEEIEEARARAAMIAQILSGRGVAGMSQAALVRAAAEAQRRQSGKGKAPMRSAGKGPGKGKGLPPRPRRPSNASWDEDDEDDSSSSDSDDSDHELLIEAYQEVANMGHDIRGGAEGGGKHFVKRTASTGAGASAPLAESAAASAPAPGPAPKVAGKMPVKQPRARRNASISSATPAISKAPAAGASTASSAPTPTSLSANLPPLPLPALPTPSPAPPTPALLSASSLPPLPPLRPSVASSVAAAQVLAPLPKTTAAPLDTSLPSTTAAAPASNTALPFAPASVPTAAGSGTTTPAAPPKKRSHKKKVPPKDGAAGDAVAKDDAPAKPRPSPYAPAPLAPGAPLPDEAPAENRQVKPPYTYASLIAQAIARSEAKKLTLHDVYEWVISRWPYFRENQAGWQNSIRHNLTPARGFLKVLRRPDEPGKGSFWEIDPAQMANFDGHHFRMKKTEGAAAAAATAASKAKAAAAAPSPSPGPAAAPSPAIVAAVEASTAAAAKPGSKTATAAAPPSRPSSASPAPQSAAVTSATLSKPLPIVISALPASFVKPTPPPESTSAAATDELTASLLADPPIVLHEGVLILRPEIFGASLSAARLAELQEMPASAVLPILQAQVVQHFKDKMRKSGAAAKPAPATKASKATKAPKAASTKAPKAAASQKKPRTAAASATAGTKRAREPDIDLTSSLTASASSKPAKVAKMAAR